MRMLSSSLVLLLFTVASTQADWSWGEKNEKALPQAAEPGLLQGEEMITSETTQLNVTVLDDIVDEIISSKQGRSLNRDFDEVYSDPTIKEALESGDDLQARNLIKERLCTLGLMQCDNEDVLEKRPYVAPEDLIYAQPVDIQPIGRPVASIPIRGPPRAYHQQPKPSLYPPPRPQKIPPRKVGYGLPKPGYAADKYGHVSSGSYNGNFGNGDVVYGQKPHISESPYAYESNRPGYGKPQTIAIPISQSTGGLKGDGTVQQHVHHHYVHGDSDKNPKVIIKPVPVPANGGIHQPIDNFETYDGGFKPMSGPYTPSAKPVYEQEQAYSTFNKNPYQQTVNAQYNTNGEYDTNSLNGYGNDFYKKEFNLGQSGNNLGPQTFDFNKGSLQEPRVPELDCVCVPYDQCPNQEVIGKRDDLILPIDPRHKNSAIEAINDDQSENSTLSADIEATTIESVQTSDDSDTKKVSKREVKEEMRGDGIEETEEKTIEPRSYETAGSYGRTFGNGNKNVQPTFGISFGLPQSSYGGYPLNPYHPNPIQNPYGPAINGGGLNLGLISVNPLVSLQVSKDENGDKVVKPYVNLHVTPNEHVVNKIGHLINDKKHHLLNKHEHYHHFPYKPHYHYAPHVPYQHHHSQPQYQTIHKPTHYYHTYKSTPEVSEHYISDFTNDMLDNLALELQDNGFDSSLFTSRAGEVNNTSGYAQQYNTYYSSFPSPGANRGGRNFRFPNDRRKRATVLFPKRQGFYNPNLIQQQCRPNQVCCRRPLQPSSNRGQCGIRHSQGINGRIKTPSYVDGESEFGEYPWQAAILKKDPKESVYVCGGTLIDHQHIITAAHCVKQYNGFDLRVRLGEWDVNHDVEFFPYIERDVVSVHVHPKYYAGTLDNDLAILKLDAPVDYTKYPHISPACLPDKYTDYSGQRCWTTGWGKDAFGDYGKYQNILKEVDVPVLSHGVCQQQLRNTRLGYNYVLNPGFMCAGGEEGKDACKGDGGGPMVCERGGTWQVVGVVSWGIGCGQVNVPGVYVKVAHYLDWISQVTGRFSQF